MPAPVCRFPVTVRRGELFNTSSPGIPFIPHPLLSPPHPPSLCLSVSFARNVGDTRTRGCWLHPVHCCSLKCIIHEMTWSGRWQRRGCCTDACKKGCGTILVEGLDPHPHTVFWVYRDPEKTPKSLQVRGHWNWSYSHTPASDPASLFERNISPLLLPQSFPE